jgi:hypothetical protein
MAKTFYMTNKFKYFLSLSFIENETIIFYVLNQYGDNNHGIMAHCKTSQTSTEKASRLQSDTNYCAKADHGFVFVSRYHGSIRFGIPVCN